MMYFLWSMPPQTLGAVRPASLATSTNVTGEAAEEERGDWRGEALRVAERFQFQSGVARASRRELPRTTSEEPRKRRRNGFMRAGYLAAGFAVNFGKLRGTMPTPSLTAMILSMGTLVSFSTRPLGQVISSESIFARLPRPNKSRGSLADM